MMEFTENLKKKKWITFSFTDNFKSRDASASKNACYMHYIAKNAAKVAEYRIIAFFGSYLCTQVKFGENVDVQDVT